MLAKVMSCAIVGLDGAVVEVETDITPGLPFFAIVGLPDTAVQEAKERVRAAIRNSGFSFPMKRIAVNLAPADIKKEGPSYDLSIAMAILISSEQVAADTAKTVFLGELSMDGSLRHTNGILPMVAVAREQGFTKIVVPETDAKEAALIEGVEIIPIESLAQLAGCLQGEIPTPEYKVEPAAEAMNPSENIPIEQSTGADEVKNGGVDEQPKPPAFVETEFAVSKGGTKGVMRNSYQVLPDGSYVLKSEVEAKGIASLFFGKLKQQSEGIVTEQGLKPSSYFYQYGNNEDKAQRASFDWQAGQVTMQNGKKIKTAPLVEGTQDFLSFMYQFMFVPPLEQMQLSIANGKKLGTYDYGFEGEETLSTKMGELHTVHIFRSRADSDEKTELWLALDYHYLPVKVRRTEKDGYVIEQIATLMSTQMPASDTTVPK